MPKRLGYGIKKTISTGQAGEKCIWLHALSVGEVTSVLPLIIALRQNMPRARIIMTVSTSSGKKLAETVASPYVDSIISSPIDILPAVYLFVQRIQPDIYIQVETDFWPNLSTILRRKKIPQILVNGRISEKSMARYRRFHLFFQPIFKNFAFLSMQTENDRKNMLSLGISPEKILTLGNLKFDTVLNKKKNPLPDFFVRLAREKQLIIAGSTHPGEEDIILQAFREIITENKNARLIIAPRNISCGAEIQKKARELSLSANRRSENISEESDVLIVDSLGELIHFYKLGQIAFVGGSLIDYGGHNPIEPALMNIPVLFGKHMSDFREIRQLLLETGGALEVSEQTLVSLCNQLLQSKTRRKEMGDAAHRCIEKQQGVIPRHMHYIRQLLDG
ncbi:3-deoxy-D-manno-octulosonic acid transferase [Desulfotalea psychrophila]|nr:3-deoxy-D-manno-octulosonic acid transferase [Desulfotalea psychrophila]